MTEGLLDPQDVARILKVSVRSVRRLVDDGTLKYARVGGHRLMRFKREHVMEMLTFEATPKRKPEGGDGGQ